MNNYGKMSKGAAILALSTAIAACGGGGGSSSGGDGPGGNGPGGGSGGLPGTLSGLTGDADNQDLLYFSHTYEDGEDAGTGMTLYRSKLYALDPANPEAPTPLPMDTLAAGAGSERGWSHYVPLYEADIDEDDGSVSNYRVTDVLFLHNRLNGSETSEGFARVGTEVGAGDPVRVSNETYLNAGLVGAGINPTLIRQNYADANHAAVVYGLLGNEKRVRMSFSDSDQPQQAMSAILKHVVALGENDAPGYQHYLVLRSHADLHCSGSYRLVTARAPERGWTGQSIGVDNLLPGNKEAQAAEPLGGPLNDGTQYLMIHTLVDTGGAECDDEGGTLWRYRQEAIPALVQVLDENGDPLVFPGGAFGGAVMPQDRHLARDGGVLYFGTTDASDLNPQDIYRVEGDSWSVLSAQEESLGWSAGFIIADEGRVAASVGNEVVSWNSDGSDRQVLDSSDAAWMGMQTNVLGSRDGWIFYNRADAMGRDDAVARKIDGSDSMVIENAQWIGASLSGEGESINNMTELSEVFLETNNREIAAVSAATPKEGVVVLGQHNGPCEFGVCYSAFMFGMAPGPHRLIQVQRDDDTTEVYYVNTREQGSLRKVIDDPTGEQRPVTGF